MNFPPVFRFDLLSRRALYLCALFATALVLCDPASAQERTLTPGQAYFDQEKFVEFTPGALPIVLTSPHGGRLKPRSISDRTDGVLGIDENTQELTREIAAEFLRRTGRPPHVIISLLHRSKLDPNREVKEAAQGDAGAERAWKNFHSSIRAALRTAVQAHGFAFLIDVHGHGHENAWLELGYGVGIPNLNQTDAALDAADVGSISTLNDLVASGKFPSFSALLRGPESLGALFNERGYRAVPSPKDKGPGTARYFNGGYIVRTYGRDMKGVDAVQIESYKNGVRATAADRKAFAKAVVDVMVVFLERHYHYSILPSDTSAKPDTPATTPEAAKTSSNP